MLNTQKRKGKREMEQEVYIAESAVLVGDVRLANDASIWHHATLRGDTASIVIGENSNIQDNAVVHAGDGFQVTIGKGVTVGHSAIVHGCTILDNTVVGMGAIVMNGACVGKNCIIGAGALVTQQMLIPDGSLVIGSPAKVKRPLTEEEIQHNRDNAKHYVLAAREQLGRS